MYPPIFEVCAQSPEAAALLGQNPMRLWPFGDAPQENRAYPYAVWQLVTGSPENYITGLPDIDQYTVQVDVYALSANVARTVAQALRDAIEPHAHIVAWRGESLERETRNYRLSFDSEWFNPRN